ncbi:MAG: hypothetical protein J5527_09375 [Treponema sp.]|nr:hypothetical protein [Treponema sp.]
MIPKFSKADAYRTDKPIVSLCNSYEGQYIIKDMNKIGEYEGTNYWNCFDIYEANGIRFFYGNGVNYTNNFSTDILKDCSSRIEKIIGWSESDIQLRKNIVKEFTDSIHAGIKDPSPIKNFTQFKKELVKQVDSYDKLTGLNKLPVDMLKISSILTKHIVSDEAKVEINQKLQTAILENQRDCAGFYQNDKTDKEKLSTTLILVYRQEKDRQIHHDKKNLEKSYEICR